MTDFFLHPKVVYEILKEKGVKYLYHANTVLTSLTFIQQNALLSRSYVETNNLIQTPQNSDEEDKKYNVWDDVFLDGFDLHNKYKRPNHYGPVLFVMNLEILLAPSLPPLLVTLNNPWYWKEGEELNARYAISTDVLKERYLSDGNLDSRIMFTFRSPNEFIRLKKYLNLVQIDKPHIYIKLLDKEKNIGDYAHDKIREALDQNGMHHIPIEFRHANQKVYYCPCNLTYTKMYNLKNLEFAKRFSSKKQVNQ